jgi:membrane protein implicated in regulation of membrane protease activity
MLQYVTVKVSKKSHGYDLHMSEIRYKKKLNSENILLSPAENSSYEFETTVLLEFPDVFIISLLYSKQTSRLYFKFIIMSTSIFSRPELVWFIIGLVLFLLELVLPGFVIFSSGSGHGYSPLCLIANPGINLQAIVFGATSILSLFLLRKMIQKRFFYSKEELSKAVEDEFSGKEAIALTDFSPGNNGKVEFKGTQWKAESESVITEGQRVIIKNKDSFKLIVEPKK